MGNEETTSMDPPTSNKQCGGLNPNNCSNGHSRASSRLFNFSEALQLMDEGAAMSRTGWNAKHHISIVHPSSFYNSRMLPYFEMRIAKHFNDEKQVRVPWVASHTDLLADDWYIVKPE